MPTTFPLPLNNINSSVGAPYVAANGSVTLATGTGAAILAEIARQGLSAISASTPLRFTLARAAAFNAAGQLVPNFAPTLSTVYEATGLSGDTLTGLTVKEGGTDRSYAVGDTFAVYGTAGAEALRNGAITALETTSTTVNGATFITRTTTASLPNSIAMSGLATGLVKNTTATGAPSIAVPNTDYAPGIAPLLTGQVVVQAATASTDLQVWNDNTGTPIAALNNAGSVGVGTTQLGIGTATPLRPLHISANDIGAGSYIALENTDTTHNNNGSVITARTTTTGVGAASFQEYASTTFKILTHDQPTLAATWGVGVKNGAGGFSTLLFDQLGNTTITGAFKGQVQDAGGQVFNIKHPTYGCKCDTLTAAATNVVIGSTLTASGLTTADQGKTISVPGAGTAGAALVTTISTVSGTTITLASPIITAAGTATITYGTNDTTGFRAALTAASAVNGTVLVPVGNTLLTAQVNLPSNVSVVGSGSGSVITGTGGFEVLFTLANTTGVQFRNLKLNGGASVGIYAYTATNFIIENCIINNFNRLRDTLYTSGVLMYAATIGWIKDCQFSGNGYGGTGTVTANGAIVFQDNPTTDSTFINVVHNNIVGAGLYGILGFDVSDCRFIDNAVNQGNIGTTTNNDGYGILIYDGQHAGAGRNYVNRNVIAFNNVSNCYGTGIYCVVGIDNIITHNTVRNVVLTMDTGTLRPGGIVVNESMNTVVDNNIVNTVGVSQTNAIAGIASLIGTNDSITNNKISNVVPAAGDGINVGGTGEQVTSTVGGRYSGNTIKSVGRYGMNFDTATAKVDLLVESNFVQNSGSVGYFINNVQYSQFNHNKVRDFGAGSQGFLISSSSLTTNVTLNACEAEVTTANTGRGFQIATGPNTINGCVASGIGVALGVGFLDQSNTTPPVVYTGYSSTRGTVTTPFSRSGQQSCLGDMYNSGGGASGTTPKVVGERYFDTTNKQFYVAVGTGSSADWMPVGQPLLTGTSAPATTPFRLGLDFLDTTNKKAYKSLGTSSSADWALLN